MITDAIGHFVEAVLQRLEVLKQRSRNVGDAGAVSTLAEAEAGEAYQRLVEHSLQGLAILQDFRILFANPALEQITGYAVDELISLSPDEIKAMVHSWSLPRVPTLNMVPQMDDTVNSGGEVWVMQMRGSAIQYRG